MITYDDLARWGACNRKPGERYSKEALEERLGRDWALIVEVEKRL